MLDPDIKIQRQTQEALFGDDGKVSSAIRVQFMVGNHGPFSERFPKDTFSAAQRDVRLNAFAREVRT